MIHLLKKHLTTEIINNSGDIMKEKYNNYINKEYKFDKLTMLGIIALMIVIAGVFGYIYEFIFYYFDGGMKEFYLQGGNFLPWINIYAIGALLVFFLTFKLRKNPLLVFLVSFIICGLLEFVAGWGLYTFFDGTRYWDYNVEILNFGNIAGFICLRSVLFFGLSSLMLIYLIVPFIFYLAIKMNKKNFLILSFTLCSIVLLDEIYNLIIARIFGFPRASRVYTGVGLKYVEHK